jgi:hypothetical protein
MYVIYLSILCHSIPENPVIAHAVHSGDSFIFPTLGCNDRIFQNGMTENETKENSRKNRLNNIAQMAI